VSIPQDRAVAEKVVCREVGCWAKPGQRCKTHAQAHKTRIQLGRDVAFVLSFARIYEPAVRGVLERLADRLAKGAS
jgi:hypothetical protein